MTIINFIEIHKGVIAVLLGVAAVGALALHALRELLQKRQLRRRAEVSTRAEALRGEVIAVGSQILDRELAQKLIMAVLSLPAEFCWLAEEVLELTWAIASLPLRKVAIVERPAMSEARIGGNWISPPMVLLLGQVGLADEPAVAWAKAHYKGKPLPALVLSS